MGADIAVYLHKKYSGTVELPSLNEYLKREVDTIVDVAEENLKVHPEEEPQDQINDVCCLTA
jgi:hypothetical protein